MGPYSVVMQTSLAALFGGCWASFIGTSAYRLIRAQSLLQVSSCPSCNKRVRPLDLIPVASYLALGRACRFCRARISPLYPLVELLGIILGPLHVLFLPHHTLVAYAIMSTALLAVVRTDLENFLILRICSVWLIPVGLLLSAFGLTNVTLMHSLAGAFFGYSILSFTNYLFRSIKGHDGLGEGDAELLAMIGSFCGFFGTWWTLTLAACLASIVGLLVGYKSDQYAHLKLPFGPFLAIGAWLWLFAHALA
jgi:leader peptidase (prepilin peptidase)/N-methyltransferase